jgi:CubicO group peptidase (beta-lactamase class C family)
MRGIAAGALGAATSAMGAATGVVGSAFGAVLRPAVTPALELTRARVARVCPVPDDLASVTTISPEAPSPYDVEAVWSRVEGLYRSGVHPAVQVCIRHQGEIVLDRSIGYARGVLPGRALDPERAVLITPDTPVNLFSAGKAITAMLIHLLEERALVDIDQPVARYLPDFARYGKAHITLRQVLTHRAGIPSLPPEAVDLDLLTDHDRLETTVCDLRRTAPVGGPPAYHAITGGLVMEAVVRRVSGKSLQEMLRTEVKEPLGLRWFDLGVQPDEIDQVAVNTCTGLPILPPLSLVFDRLLGMGWDQAVLASNDARFLSGVLPSGNMVVTARDTTTFYQCLLDGGRAGTLSAFDGRTVRRAIEADRDGIDIDRRILLPMRYSAGFMLGSETISLFGWNHPRAFGHLGLANSFTWADPDRDLVVALLTTGKAVLGTHVPALLQLITEIHRTFPRAGDDPRSSPSGA